MLKKLKQQGITILVSTPYMDEASMCDRIAFIQEGTILTINTPEQIIADFPHKIYAVEEEDNYKILKQLRQNPAVRSVFSFGDTLHVIFNEESATSTPLSHRSFKEITPTIEDCFMALINK